MQFAAHIADTPATLKQSHGHQTYSDNIDLKKGYYQAKFDLKDLALMVSEKKIQH